MLLLALRNCLAYMFVQACMTFTYSYLPVTIELLVVGILPTSEL